MRGLDLPEKSRAFMARISHEIRTPLHGIHGAIDLLEDTAMTPVQREYLEVVRNAADTLMSVVNELVDYANPRTDQSRASVFPFEPRTCVEQVTTVMGPMAASKGLAFANVTHYSVPWRVEGDPNALRQILNGMLAHVIRHTTHGTVVIEVDAPEADQAGAVLRFRASIEDSEFESGSDGSADASADDARDADVPLKRCRELAVQLGGRLHVESTPSGAIQFELTARFNALPDQLPIVEIGPEALAGREVLVVDDTATNRMVYREQLANWGCETVEVASGRDALEVIESRTRAGRSIDIALIDHAMPEMDGAELALAIRAMPAAGDLPLVLCTSTPQGGDAARMAGAGFAAYLTKPIRFDCLRKVMCLLLGSRPADRVRMPLITQHIVAEMDRAAQSLLYIAETGARANDVPAALQHDDLSCDSAAFGEDFDPNRYGAVLIDGRHSLDGALSEAARLRALFGIESVPVVLVLGQQDAARAAECEAATNGSVLIEPVQRADLIAVLRPHLGLEEPESLDDIFEEWNLDDPIQGSDVDNASPIDLNRLDQITAGDESLRRELIEMFLADTEDRFAALESAIIEENGQQLNRTAHSIKGSCANMGATALQTLALELEALGSENRFDEAPELFKNLRSEFEVVKVFFGSL